MILTELAKTGVFIPEVGIGTWHYHAGPGPLRKVRRVRLGLTVFAFLVVAFMVLAPIGNLLWINLAIFLLVLLEETLGRWIFFAQRNPLM